MELFQERINEYVDWTTGKHYYTGRNVTDNMKPSGKVIRELLQDRLKTPIFIPSKENVGQGGVYIDDGYWRIFSSKDAYELWLTDKQAYAELELAKFPKQSEYEIQLTGFENNVRYLIKGNSDQSAASLTYTWDILKGQNPVNDSIRVTYIIENRTTKRSQTFTNMFTNTQKTVSINIYNYLDEGENIVTINFQGVNTSAATGQTLILNMLKFEIEADWNYSSYHAQGEPLMINSYRVLRNDVSAAVDVYASIDGSTEYVISDSYAANYIDIQKANIEIRNSNRWQSSTDGNPVKHNLQLWAQTQYNGTIFYSNILYWEFEFASSESLPNHFVNIHTSIPSEGKASIPVIEPSLNANQYISTQLEYGYYTDSGTLESSINVEWKLVKESSTDTQEIGTYNINRNTTSILEYIPTLATEARRNLYLVASYNGEELNRVLINITPNTGFMEQGGYVLKLSAYGKQNDDNVEQKWEYGTGNNKIITEFTGIDWTDNKGWYKNSFRTFGVNSYAEIKLSPLMDISNGKTIEIDFESEKISNTGDVLILIGNRNGARIEITANSAGLYNSSNEKVIETNFKANERLHLCFIFNRNEPNSTDNKSDLIYITNNGILERAVSGLGSTFTSNGNIKIGGSRSGVRVYSIRVYDYNLSYMNAYNNYLFDSEDKIAIKTKNAVINESTNIIDYDLCRNKIDTILIKGDLSQLLKSTTEKDQSTTDVEISRVCPYDTNKNFICTGAMIRKHGQSTLNYPVPSMKVWFNKSKSGATPIFSCPGQEDEGLAKNRYRMKDNSIPANKFVLQANYSDSSGVHNGSLQRLINETWYNAKINGEYKLRTLPQLFSSNQTITRNSPANELNEVADLYKDIATGKNGSDKLWKDYAGTNSEFPYKLQVGPDSFPCVVFYSDTSSGGNTTFLGLYVFMEDKKSDFTYGERSIYYYKDTKTGHDNADDPFVLKYENTKNGKYAIELPNGNKQALDTGENRVWDNANVLRIEGLTINTPFSSFLSFSDTTGTSFDEDYYIRDKDGNITEHIYRWEQDFELIYPDPDDLEGKIDEVSMKDTTKFGRDSKFVRTCQPWVDFFYWVTSTYQNPEKFQTEAAQHFDIYMMAAYYIVFLRFGLVDSVERNAQWKTYDGRHWHCEPWDMDIALGNMNTGGIAFEPPVDRDTTFKTDRNTYAYSGRTATTSNWIWDAFEGWRYWMEQIVPAVAQALYEAGLTYKNVSKMFDEEYQDKWCEILYNESMSYKYIKSRGTATTWLAWLQGARTTHRHWWLSTSMNYWDSKWNCGDYKNHKITIFANHEISKAGKQYITIKTNGSTYLSMVRESTTIDSQYATLSSPAYFDITDLEMSNKVQFHIYGATYVEEFDGSAFADGISSITFAGAYDDVLGAPLKKVNLGCPYETDVTGKMIGSFNGILTGITFSDGEGHDAAASLQDFNITGQIKYTSGSLVQEIETNNKTELRNFYGRGSGITSFRSSKSGNTFVNIELPGKLHSSDNTINNGFNELVMTNSTWENLTWYDAELDLTSTETQTYLDAEGHEVSIEVPVGEIEYTRTRVNPTDATDRYNIPFSLQTVRFIGSTGKSEKTKKFVIDWIRSIRAYLEYGEQNGTIILGGAGKYADCHTIDEALELELNERTLEIDNIKWDHTTCEDLVSYNQLELISKFNSGHNNADNYSPMLKGYIEVSMDDGELSVEQLTQLKEWYGNQIFNVKSVGVGLVIDQSLNYIKINVGGAKVVKNESTGELEITIEEGNKVTLSATRFQLQETDTVTYWGVKEPGSYANGGLQYKGCTISTGKDGLTYLTVSETEFGDRTIEVTCSMVGEELSSSVLIHILAVSYPANITLAVDQTRNGTMPNNQLRDFAGAYVFWKGGLYGEFYPNIQWLDQGFSEDTPDESSIRKAKISDILYTVTNEQGTNIIGPTSYTTFAKGQNTTGNVVDDYLTYTLNATPEYRGIVLTTTNLPDKNSAYYTLTITIRYSSNKTVRLTTNIIVIDDANEIVQYNGGLLYDALKDHYMACNGGATITRSFYKADLLSLTGTLSFVSYPLITDLTTLDRKSIFEYLPNIEGVDLSGCRTLDVSPDGTNVPSEDARKNFVMGACKKLTTFTISNCVKMGTTWGSNISKFSSIDLSSCTAIERVYAKGTFIDILLPRSSNLTVLELGTPSSVSLTNQNNLVYNAVKVDSSSRLTSVVLNTDSQTKADLFNTFAQIILNE